MRIGFFKSRERSEETAAKVNKADAKKTAFLYPGQGSGSVFTGMGLDLWLNSKKAREVFEEADDRLGWSLSQMCFFGPEEELLKTANSQLACLVTSIAYSRELEDESADFYAGFSAGIYAAYVEADVISFPIALQTLKERGRLMDEDCVKNPGKMIVLYNFKYPDEILALMDEFKLGGLYNSKDQIVLSGPIEQIEKAKERINKDRLAKIFPEAKFKTQGAFHSICIANAKKILAKFLEGLIFKDPSKPILANTLINGEARFIKTGDEAKQQLVDHMDQIVGWYPGMELLVLHGVRRFLENGAGEVLTNNLKRSFGRKISAIPVSLAMKGHFQITSKQKKQKKQKKQ